MRPHYLLIPMSYTQFTRLIPLDTNNMSLISEPHCHDYLFGHGNEMSRHVGNLFVRQFIIPISMPYETNLRDARKRLAYKIYEDMYELDPPGRFLSRSPSFEEPGWIEVDEKDAIYKICRILDKYRKVIPKKKENW